MSEYRGVAIVTGSSRGTGAATAKLLAKEGFDVVVNYSKSEAGAKETVAACEALGAKTLLCQADVSQDDDCRRMVEDVVRKWGRVDALVTNAGITKFCAADNLEGLTKEDFLNIYGVNLVGPYQMIKSGSPPDERERERGCRQCRLHRRGDCDRKLSCLYASKAALIAMTKALARALVPEIRINAVCPGFIQEEWLKDGMGKELYEAVKNYLEGTLPLRATCTSGKVAEAIFFFITGADLVTGETLLIDGGQHLG